MSCSANAWSPASMVRPDDLAFATAVSRIVVPDARVRRKASSSAYAICEIREKPVASSG